jgi:erythromycin esterase-like protein
VGWLRSYNESLPTGKPKVGFYGLDLYSLYSSMEVVIDYLDKMDPAAAKTARQRYACFDHFGRDSQSYARLTSVGLSESCETEVVEQLLELQRKSFDYLRQDGAQLETELFDVLQNARVVKNAEEYYRTMLHGRVSSWNLRDAHMVETLDLLTGHLQRSTKAPKVVVWAHNSHLGDARATQMGEYGEWNVGELVRKRHEGKAFLLGFTTYTGTVTAASGWDSPAERKSVRPALSNSYEALFHQTGIPRFILNFRLDDILRRALSEPRLERAIGVIYLPETERTSHYFHARLADQFDAVFHIDETRAVEPLEKTGEWESGEAPETYPSAV